MPISDIYGAGSVGLLGLTSITAGSLYGTHHKPSAKQRSAFQHIAAGTVFAGLVSDVFFKLLEHKQTVARAAGGLVLGTAALDHPGRLGTSQDCGPEPGSHHSN